MHRYAPVAPPVATDEEQLRLVGSFIMHAWDTGSIQGWFKGKITHKGVSPRDQIATPSANFVVKYDKRVTGLKELDGRVASTLTPDKYGPREWWLLLERNEQ